MLRWSLADAGNGRRLDRLGELLIDRPSGAARGPAAAVESWSNANYFYSAERKIWLRERGPESAGRPEEAWLARLPEDLICEATLLQGGQLGFFADHAPLWRWMDDELISNQTSGADCILLNLFAYTGMLSCAAARRGCRVVHLDASSSAVHRARRNAQLNGVAEDRIRYIVDDAMAFAARELKRNRRYHYIALDPPAFGRAAGGAIWKLERDLIPLLKICRALLHANGRALLSLHAAEMDESRFRNLCAQAGFADENIQVEEQQERAESGVALRCGWRAVLSLTC
ncbi:MAG: class I SAM-dependent methyltransferase [Leptospirales bacterium]|nr:class I SAM-dependent methyltransferase [Leptospirales bacterium]